MGADWRFSRPAMMLPWCRMRITRLTLRQFQAASHSFAVDCRLRGPTSLIRRCGTPAFDRTHYLSNFAVALEIGTIALWWLFHRNGAGATVQRPAAQPCRRRPAVLIGCAVHVGVAVIFHPHRKAGLQPGASDCKGWACDFRHWQSGGKH